MKIKRQILPDLLERLSSPEILILMGARQVGKTFLLNELEKYCIKKKKRTKYFNLELPEDSRYFAKDIAALYKEITHEVDYLFIDEFQYFNNASKFLKAIYDDKRLKIKVIASGSSSLEMHKHLKESLAGRKQTRLIRPLSYLEFNQTKEKFSKYLQSGGNPGLVNKKSFESKIELLKEILQTYIMKDVKALIKEKNISAFNNLLYNLASSQGQVISTNSLASELKVSNITVESYLDILEQTYVLYKVPSFAGNLSNELKKSKKYYLYDLGVRNAILNDFSLFEKRIDKGAILETYLLHFLISNCPQNGEIRFWRTRSGDEIDFVFLKNRKPYILEAKAKLTKLEIPKPFHTFIKNYPGLQGAYVVNLNLEGTLDYKGLTVNFIKYENLELDDEFKSIFKNDQ